VGQDVPAPSKEALTVKEGTGIPPRATPGDYQAHAAAGTVTIGAEFRGHYVPTDEGTYTTEDYVMVEVGLYGPPGAKLTLSVNDYSLRVNGKKAPIPSQPYAVIFESLKDPEMEPPSSANKSESKTSVGHGGRASGTAGEIPSNLPPPPVHIPIEVQRAMQQRVRKASLGEGDRALPQAGLIFFSYHGKTKGIHSIELIYEGAAGKAAMALQP
jgi:hypothetical protein